MVDSPSRLIVIAGPARGQTVTLNRAVTIGRDQASACPIPDLALSRRHCTVESGPQGFVLRDLESLNGTIVNGVPVRMHDLADGDQIRVGDSALIFVAGTAAATAGRDREADGSTVPGPLVLDSTNTVLRFTTDTPIEHDLVGQSRSMRDLYERIARAAPTESTVLIRGESGTGKELVARAIHANSARAKGPFVPINCAALPEGLMESELFGHERGAFTGAIAQKRGRIELASGGTVFFDEIGELAPSLQVKFLRVLQERQLERLGSARPIPVDIRVVAATNRDLDASVRDGTFRHDLFYRLNVVSLVAPPLRDRLDDVPLLVTYFVRKHAPRCKRRVRGVSPGARARLMSYEWPGNIRELENAIERALVLGSGAWIELEDLPEQLLESAPPDPQGDGYHAGVNAAKRQLIRRAIATAGGNCAQAARLLKLQPTYLHRIMKNLGLRNEHRSAALNTSHRKRG